MIVNNDLIIRTIKDADLEILHKWNNSQTRGSFQEFHFDSKNNIKKDYEENGFVTDKFKMLIIEVKELQEIGLIYINFIRAGLIRIGLVICEDSYKGNGYGTKVTKLIVEHLFNNYPVVRIEAETDRENIGAQKVLEKAGFKREGVLRNYRYHHREWRDFIIYSILLEDLCTNY